MNMYDMLASYFYHHNVTLLFIFGYSLQKRSKSSCNKISTNQVFAV